MKISVTEKVSTGFFTAIFFILAFFVCPQPVSAQLTADDVLGQLDSSGNDTYTEWIANTRSTTSTAKFFQGVNDVLYDETRNRLFVLDANRILVWDLDSNDTIDPTQDADYVIGQTDFTTNTSGTTQSKLNFPLGMVLDETAGRLFVADSSNDRVLVFDVRNSGSGSTELCTGVSTTGIATGMNASCVLGQANFTTGTGSAAQNRVDGPADVAFDPDNNYLYVAEVSNHRVTVFDVASITNGENAINVIGQSLFTTKTTGTSSTKFNLPQGVTFDPTDDVLYVADQFNNRVLVFDVTGGLSNGMAATNVLGQAIFTTATSGTTASTMYYPYGVEYDASRDYLFVSETQGGTPGNNRVTVFDVSTISDGESAINVLGQPNLTTEVDGIDNNVFVLAKRTHVMSNNILLATDIYRVNLFDIATITNGEATVTAMGQIDRQGNITPRANNQYGNVVTPTTMSRPNDVVLDDVNHRLFVAEGGNNRVSVFNLDSNNNLTSNTPDYFLGVPHPYRRGTSAPFPDQLDPTGLEYDSENQYLFVFEAFNDRVTVFDVSSITTGEDAIYAFGVEALTGYGGDTTQDTFSTPGFGAYDAVNKRLFVADQSNYRVMVFDLSGGITTGMDASYVIGQDDFVSTDFDTTADRFAFLVGPRDLAYDPTTEYLYVTDEGNARVLVFDVDPDTMTNGMDAIYVLGQEDFVSSDQVVDADGMTNPVGLALFDNQTLLVTDYGAERVMYFDISNLSNGMDAVGIIGQPNFTASDLGVSTTEIDLSDFAGIGIDNTNNRVYLADEDNNRVLIFDLVNMTTTSLSDGEVSTAYSTSLVSTDNEGAVTYTLDGGSLPAGINLSSGSLTGTPTTAGSSTFTIQARDTISNIGYFLDNQELTLTITAVGGGGNNNSGLSAPSGASGYQGGEPQCTDLRPVGQPQLFQIDSTLTTADLYFTPVFGVNKYAVTYGFPGSREEHGDVFEYSDTSGVVKHQIKELQPNTTYFFKITPINGCAAGDQSNTMQVRTAAKTGAAQKYFKDQPVSSSPTEFSQVSDKDRLSQADDASDGEEVLTENSNSEEASSPEFSPKKEPEPAHTTQDNSQQQQPWWRTLLSKLGLI